MVFFFFFLNQHLYTATCNLIKDAVAKIARRRWLPAISSCEVGGRLCARVL